MERFSFTGIGVISSIGSSKEEFWNNMFAGKKGFKPIANFPLGNDMNCRIAGEIVGFNVTDYLEMKGLRTLDRLTNISLCAAFAGIKDSKFEITHTTMGRCGIVLGNSFGSLDSITGFFMKRLEEGFKGLNPAYFPNTVINSPTGNISIKLGLKGPNITVSGGMTAALDAIAYSMDTFDYYQQKLFLVGGVEELSFSLYQMFKNREILANCDEDPFVNYPNDRKGIILGEGAVIFTLEKEESARERKAEIYGNVTGYARGFYASDFEIGLRKVTKETLENAAKAAQDIDIVITPFNGLDQDEIALKVFKDLFPEAILYNPKELLGETISAGAAFQVLAALGIIKRRQVPGGLKLTKQPIILISSIGDNGSIISVIIE